MLNEETKRKLLEMRLSSMAKEFDTQLEDPKYAQLSFEERFGMLVDAEHLTRKNNHLKRLMRNADFSYPNACMEDISYLPDRNLDADLLLRLGTCKYISDFRNVVVQGATGSGKTYIATALGVAAIRQFYQVKYIRLPDLLCDLQTARAMGTFRTVVNNYAKIRVLILDEWLLYPLSEEESRDLLEIAERRYHTATTILCSQFTVSGWFDKIPNPLLADAVCDRIAHDAYTVTLGGKESMRKLMGIPQDEK